MTELFRSLFFAPANRPDLVAKFPRFDADCCVVDLEDGTPEHDKASARAALSETVARARNGLRGALTVRVNVPSSAHFMADLEAAFAADIDGVVIPKLERPEELAAAYEWILRRDREAPRPTGRFIVGGIESIRGVMNAPSLCQAGSGLAAVFFGAEDYTAEIGGRRTRSGDEVFMARSWTVAAAKAAGLAAIDQAVVDIRDDMLFTQDAHKGRDMGYVGKICVTPGQVKLAHAAFSPSAEEVDYATRLIATYEKASATGVGTIDFEGKMIDPPLLKRAQSIMALATLDKRA